MRASDLVGTSGLAFYAEVGLVLFFFAFLVVLVQLGLRSRAPAEWEAQGRLPLEDGEEALKSGGSSSDIGGYAP